MLSSIIYFYAKTIWHLTRKLQTSTLLHHADSLRERPGAAKSVYDNYNRYRTLQRELWVYVIATTCCQIWGIVTSIEYTVNNDEKPDSWVLLLYTFFTPFQGFVNTLLFFNSSSIRKRIGQSQHCSKRKCCWIRFSPEYQPLIDGHESTTAAAVLLDGTVTHDDLQMGSKSFAPLNIVDHRLFKIQSLCFVSCFISE